jgi:hypothetical protein
MKQHVMLISRFLTGSLLLLLTACQAVTPAQFDAVTGQRLKAQSVGRFRVQMEASSSGADVVTELEKMGQSLTDALNARYVFPKGDIQAVFQDCGFANAYYRPATSTIGMCYEMYRSLQEKFNPQDALEVFRFIFLHELGHALIDQFDLPILGGEEDAADALATVLLIEGGAPSRAAVLAGVNFFDLYRSGLANNWADEHAVGPQRMFNLVCWGAGGEAGVLNNRTIAALYRETVRSGRDCDKEYLRQKGSVMDLLGPFVKMEETL